MSDPTNRPWGEIAANTRPVNPEAYEAYLKGHFHAQRETRADLDHALKYFETALQTDPGHAPAHSGIAFVWAVRNQMGYVSPSEATPRVKAAAMKAVELDPTLALAHYALGLAAWNEWAGRRVKGSCNEPSSSTRMIHSRVRSTHIC